MASDIREHLKRWGHATVARHARQHDGPSSGDHILAKTKDLAPGTKERAEKVLIGRNGLARRERMAASAGVPGMAVVPMWSCDPIPARNDADHPHDNPAAWVDIGLPDDVLPIDAAVRALERQPNGKLRMLIIREEFTGTGTQKIKSARVRAEYGGKLTKKQYQRELYKALEWLGGRIVR